MEQQVRGILHCYEFDGKGGGSPLLGAEIAKKLKRNELAWVHLDANSPETREWLLANVDYLDSIILDALLAEETRPRVTELEDGILVILRGVNLNEGMEPEDMVSLRLWIDPHRIISVQKRKLLAIEDISNLLEKGKGAKDSADFLVHLTNRLFEHMEPVISGLDERTDVIEGAIIDDPDIALRHEIIDIRQMSILLRRYISPQKDVISSLRHTDISWFSTLHKRALQESLDRVTRYIEELDTIRERSQIVKDELANIMADKMNRNMYMLSIVAAIFLPLSFLTGLLGINVGGMPGANSEIAFWIVCVLCAVFVSSMIGAFKMLKWL